MIASLQEFVYRLHKRLRPDSPLPVDHDHLQTQAAAFFGLPLDTVQQRFAEYRTLHEQKEYARLLGESKTLCFEEAFLLFLAATIVRPQQVVEIGTQYGKSTRRIIDMLNYLGLESSVTCFDIIDAIRYVGADEIDLQIEDVTDTFTEQVLTPLSPSLIYLDAHPYHLLKNVILEYLQWSLTHPSILAIHDCSPNLYAPFMWISKDDPGAITSRTGHWERHVLAEIFKKPNNSLDTLQTNTHRLQIFGTPHGLAMIAPLTLLAHSRVEA